VTNFRQARNVTTCGIFVINEVKTTDNAAVTAVM